MNRFFWKIYRALIRIKQLVIRQIKLHVLFVIKSVLAFVNKVADVLIPIVVTMLFALIVYDAGFNPFRSHVPIVYRGIVIGLLALKLLFLIRFLTEWIEPKKIKAHLFSLLLVVLGFVMHNMASALVEVSKTSTDFFLSRKLILYSGALFFFLTEVATVIRFIYFRWLNPAFLFLMSFFSMIAIGALLLILPNSTTKGIHFVDALFTATSAVCVTGLTVVDTATDFTMTGKIIILLLIQIGGLGIMTFTGLLAYLASGTASLHSQLALKDMVNSNRISNVITMVKRIVYVTFSIELLGAILVFFSVDKALFSTTVERVFFAVFHSISAFCNAGFSTYSMGLNDPLLKFNYNLHVWLGVLILLGGLGFPIVFNFFTWIRIKGTNFLNQFLGSEIRFSPVRVIQINSKLATVTTFSLLVVGALGYYIFEQDATLSQHPTTWGKVVTSFFGSVTPRTAGFNSVDMTAFAMPTVMLYLLLMWIGASPGSTGGGIKTTTFSVALLNLMAIVRGKKRTEVYHTQISEDSINKAFAIMMLSLLIIGGAVLIMSLQDAEHGVMKLAFEAFSAFSTVGLTLGITPSLSFTSKIVLISVMFIGRVGVLTFFIAFVVQVKNMSYRYPEEDIMY